MDCKILGNSYGFLDLWRGSNKSSNRLAGDSYHLPHDRAVLLLILGSPVAESARNQSPPLLIASGFLDSIESVDAEQQVIKLSRVLFRERCQCVDTHHSAWSNVSCILPQISQHSRLMNEFCRVPTHKTVFRRLFHLLGYFAISNAKVFHNGFAKALRKNFVVAAKRPFFRRAEGK